MDLLCLQIRGASFVPHAVWSTAGRRNWCIYAPRQSQRSSRAAFKLSSSQTIERRSAEYKPTIWNHDFIQSLKSEYAGEGDSPHGRRRNKLKEEVRAMLEESDPLQQLQLINHLQRLGLSYHFQGEIKRILESIYKNSPNHESLYATALEFRLLRQHGHNVPQEIFNVFRDESGNFKACLGEDCQGMLYLYEATFLSVEGESIMDDARTFASKHLKQHAKKCEGPYLYALVSHALELPLHWRMLRMEASWYIDVYQFCPELNPVLLDFAKLDFNMAQALYQEDLKHASKWWKRTCLGEKLGFSRDRLVENFLWPIGESYEPQNGYYRKMATQVNTLITTIDDIYDIYGTLEELELFTNFVERWDINALEELPEYMKICAFALYNSTNEICFDFFRDQGINLVPHTKKLWADLCKSYLLEAKWYYAKYTPTLQEYIDNAVITISAHVILFYAFIILSDSIRKESLDFFMQFPNIIRCSAMVLRLADDLGTSTDELERGDVPKSIQCYMHETGVSEQVAREFIWDLIDITWKKMNRERLEIHSTPLSETCIEAAMNLGRMAQFMYLYGDGHSSQDDVTKHRVSRLLVDPIKLDN